MNGKYMGFLEQRWVSRDPDRLARMKERRELKKKREAQAEKREGKSHE